MSNQKPFTPFVGPNTLMREFTWKALLIGLILAVVLGAANAYLGLKAGMTIAATYPAAVIGMALLKLLKGSILEENFTRTVGSIGESIAAGAIFTLPAFYISGIWSGETFSSMSSYITASLILITGGILGVLFVALLRRVMVEDQELPFPESVAAAEIHKTGQGESKGTIYLFSAMALGALVKFASAINLFASSWNQFIKTGSIKVHNRITDTGFLAEGPNISPAYLGVGYIIGPRLAALNFSGSVIAWGLLVPILMVMLGSEMIASIANVPMNLNLSSPEALPMLEEAAGIIWRNYVRIIAIGGMLTAACYTLFKMRDSLITGLKRAIKDLKSSTSSDGSESVTARTDKDLSSKWIFSGIILAAILTFIIIYFLFDASLMIAIVASTLMIVLAFFFSAVSGYLVGIIGSSNNPLSGLTLTALVVTAVILVVLGVPANDSGVATVLAVAAIVCVAAAVGGEMFQDLKAGHILGGTPWKMQVGDIIGVIISGMVMFGVLIALNQGDIELSKQLGLEAGGFGSRNLPAPQAGLMAMLSRGIVGGEMPWMLILSGVMMGIAFIMMQVKSPMLVFVGMYLPFETVAAIFVGGLIKGILDMIVAKKKLNTTQLSQVENTGVLMASGLIAGEALMGLVIAIFAIFSIFFHELLGIENPSYIVGLCIAAVIGYLFITIPLKVYKK